MNGIELLGLFAAICTTSCFVPQVVQVWRSRSTRDISLGMYALLCIGLTSWLIYGLLINSTPIILSNSLTLLLACGVLAMKLAFERDPI
ncbi:SemiSWEET transporter [Chitinibacteraceae bacterium HSL-7]